jgi:hypothetical protein
MGSKGALTPLFFFALFENFIYFKIFILFKNLHQIINMFLIYSSGLATAGHLGLKFNNLQFLILFLPVLPYFLHLSFTLSLYFEMKIKVRLNDKKSLSSKVIF